MAMPQHTSASAGHEFKSHDLPGNEAPGIGYEKRPAGTPQGRGAAGESRVGPLHDSIQPRSRRGA